MTTTAVQALGAVLSVTATSTGVEIEGAERVLTLDLKAAGELRELLDAAATHGAPDDVSAFGGSLYVKRTASAVTIGSDPGAHARWTIRRTDQVQALRDAIDSAVERPESERETEAQV